MSRVPVIKNFAKTDCVHYEKIKSRGCCGRWAWNDVCLIEYKGQRVPKICSTKTSYCNYQQKEETNVHS